MVGLQAQEEPRTYLTRREDSMRPLRGGLWRWGAAVALTVLCSSLEFAAAGPATNETPPAWVTGAVQQAAFQVLHRGRYWSDQPQVL